MTRVTLRLPDAVHKQLEELAQAQGLSLNALLVHMLTTAVAVPATPAPDAPLAEQLAYLRVHLSDLLVTPAETLPGEPPPLGGNGPQLEPPLSATIRAQRDDRL